VFDLLGIRAVVQPREDLPEAQVGSKEGVLAKQKNACASALHGALVLTVDAGMLRCVASSKALRALW